MAAGEKQHQYFKELPLPYEAAPDHEKDKRLSLGPLRSNRLPPIAFTHPIRLEASYNEIITLEEALKLALTQNLPIRISKESFRFQKYQFLSKLAGYLPSFSTSWGLSNSRIGPITTSSNSRVFQTTVRYPVFQGGGIFYSALAQYYRMKGWREALNTTVNDSLLDVYTKYNNLLLNNTLLQIRARSYEFSRNQLDLNNDLYKAGTGTQFAIMQSRAQLASDEQALLAQETQSRQAAMALAFALNIPMAINFVPFEESLDEMSIVNDKVRFAKLMNQSLLKRPELKQYEWFRLAANRNLQLASASLYPSVSFFTTYTHASTTVYPAENSDQLSGIAQGQVASSQGVGTANNTQLNQTASFSPAGNNSGTSGANTSATVVAASGGNPIANTQSGSLVTSGAVAPNFNVNTITGNSGSNISGANTASAGVFPGLTNTFQAGFSIAWSLPNLGQGSVGNILSARSLARQALLQANQQLLTVQEQVRFSYCSKVAAREQIDSAAYGVRSAQEALRLANLRLRAGVGTNLELIQAQRDYFNSLSSKAQAIVSSNLAQAQLLHDTGLISIDTLTKGYSGDEKNN